MPMKVENELMDGKVIENWLQSTKRGTLQCSEASHQGTRGPLQMTSIWPLDISPLISALWERLADLLRTKPET